MHRSEKTPTRYVFQGSSPTSGLVHKVYPSKRAAQDALESFIEDHKPTLDSGHAILARLLPDGNTKTVRWLTSDAKGRWEDNPVT